MDGMGFVQLFENYDWLNFAVILALFLKKKKNTQNCLFMYHNVKVKLFTLQIRSCTPVHRCSQLFPQEGENQDIQSERKKTPATPRHSNDKHVLAEG